MNKQSGFTLIELCVAVAIMAVLSVIAIPNMIAWRANAQLNSTGRDIFSALQYCRVEASRRGAPVMLDFDIDGNGIVEDYVAWVDDGQGTVDSEPNGILDGRDDHLLDPDEIVLFRETLPNRISIPTVPFGASGGWTSFNTRAMPNWTGNVILTNSRNRTLTVVLFSGGGVEVQ